MVDVCAAGITKGTGLAAVAERFGVAQDEVMAVGDNHNDLCMLRWAGTGVIMGNAEPELVPRRLSRDRHQRRRRPRRRRSSGSFCTVLHKLIQIPLN